MTNRIPGGFGKLRQNIISSATATLERLAPDQVKAFRQTLEQRKDHEQGFAALCGIQASPEFTSWRSICIDLIDVELQMHRVKNSLALLNSSSVSPLNQGEWVEYHVDAWAMLMQGLLYRVEKLTKGVVRGLVRPANTSWRSVETQTLKKITGFQKRVKVIRDPVAHSGGAVEVIAHEHLLESYLLIGGHVDVADMLEPMAAYGEKWHKHLGYFSTMVLNEIGVVGERLCKEVRW